MWEGLPNLVVNVDVSCIVLPPAQGAMEPVEVLVTPTPMKGHLETETPRSTTSSEQELADIVHSPLSTQVTSPIEMQRGC